MKSLVNFIYNYQNIGEGLKLGSSKISDDHEYISERVILLIQETLKSSFDFNEFTEKQFDKIKENLKKCKKPFKEYSVHSSYYRRLDDYPITKEIAINGKDVFIKYSEFKTNIVVYIRKYGEKDPLILIN